MSRLRAVDAIDVKAIEDGIAALKLARDHFRRARAVRALAKVRAALTSAGGALRHAQGIASR